MTPLVVPRWIGYPLLVAIPIVCIYGGIRLGSAGVAAHLMITSQNGTPIENWTLSLITFSIALFMYAAWAHTNHTLRFRPVTFLIVAGLVVAIFLFGAWGLLGIFVLMLLFILAVSLKRHFTTDR